jgi:hypothetical protein
MLRSSPQWESLDRHSAFEQRQVRPYNVKVRVDRIRTLKLGSFIDHQREPCFGEPFGRVEEDGTQFGEIFL